MQNPPTTDDVRNLMMDLDWSQDDTLGHGETWTDNLKNSHFATPRDNATWIRWQIDGDEVVQTNQEMVDWLLNESEKGW